MAGFLRSFRRILILSALFSVSYPAAAQMQLGLNKDSLKRVLNKMPADTLKVQTYISLGQQYENNHPDSAIYYYRLSGQLSRQLNYPAGIVRYISNYTAVLNMQGKFDESLKLNLQAMEIAGKAGLKQQLVKAMINTGAVYQYKENYGAAIKYYLQALPLLEAASNAQNLSLVYGNLCGLYRNIKQPVKALSYASQSLNYAEKNKDDYATASACINIANALKDLNKIQQSIRYLQRAYQIGLKLDDENSQETALIDLGDAWLKLKQPQQYMAAFKRALPMAEALEDVSGKAYALNGICMGLFWQKQYKQAETQLTSAIRYARLHDQKEVLSSMLLLMSDVQIALNQAENSQGYRSQYDSVSNILMNAPLLKNIQELETRYGLEKKQRELLQKNLLLQQKDRESQRQRQWLLGAAAGIVFLGLLILLLYRFYRQKQQLSIKALQVLKAEQESGRLKAVLEGEQQERRRISREMHDDMGAGLTRMLFLSRALRNQSETAGKIEATAEDLIRKMNEVIWSMNDEDNTLDSLIAYIRASTAEMLESAALNYSFEVKEPLATMPLNREFRRNVYLAVKEAVHNAIKHAGASGVQIVISNNGMLEITVQDDGKGLGDAERRQFGNGMKNMRLRMEQLNGSIEISDGGGTRIRFVIPLPV